jgi:hypothetical protein
MEIYNSLQEVEFIPNEPKELDSELIEIKNNLNKITEETKVWVQNWIKVHFSNRYTIASDKGKTWRTL